MSKTILATEPSSTPLAGKEHPFRKYKREQERISRHKIYRTTLFYTTYSIIMLVFAVREGYTLRAIAFIPAGLLLWMLTEYMSHKHILHHHFPVSDNPFKRPFSIFANRVLDPLHFGHHENPFDGSHMSGNLRDFMPLYIICAPISIFLFPPFTASIIVAAFFQGYIIEEWVHHATHFYKLRDPYSRYMKKHHLYHHTAHGMTRGYGTSSGIFDYVFGTRYPPNVRERLYGRKQSSASKKAKPQIEQV
jgi:hypothetical protein